VKVDRTPVLNYGRKIKFGVSHIFCEENACADKFDNYALFIESNWYNKLSSSFFLNFFINRYKLPMCHFC